jgi:putative spermidine/putrescine transport system permease protein
MLAPAVLVLAGLFLGGLAVAVVRSFDWLPAAGLDDPGLDAWRRVLTDPATWRGLGLSLWIAGMSTALAAGIAVAVALLMRAVGGRGLAFLLQLHLTIPHVVAAAGVMYLLGQSGSFARLSHAAGLIDRPADFPALIFDPAAVGVILHYVWKEVPFIALILIARLGSLAPALEQAARTLGATRWQTFCHVTLPHLRPALLSGMAIVFAFGFGAYEAPLLLGASHPPALPVLAWQRHTDADLMARPEAMVLCVIIAIVAAVLIRVAGRTAKGVVPP